VPKVKHKYIVFKDGNLEDIITFSELMDHSRAARALDPDRIISAGFIDIAVNEQGKLDVACFGKSITLKLESRGDVDKRVAMLRLYGESY
jgi:phage major head subunit gpT-like protein